MTIMYCTLKKEKSFSHTVIFINMHQHFLAISTSNCYGGNPKTAYFILHSNRIAVVSPSCHLSLWNEKQCQVKIQVQCQVLNQRGRFVDGLCRIFLFLLKYQTCRPHFYTLSYSVLAKKRRKRKTDGESFQTGFHNWKKKKLWKLIEIINSLIQNIYQEKHLFFKSYRSKYKNKKIRNIFRTQVFSFPCETVLKRQERLF